MNFSKLPWDIAIVMIPSYPDNSLAVRDLFNKVHNSLVGF